MPLAIVVIAIVVSGLVVLFCMAIVGSLSELTKAVRFASAELTRSADAARAFRDQSERDGQHIIGLQREARDACLSTMSLLSERARFERDHIMKCEERYQARIQETRESDPAKPKTRTH